MAVNSAVELAFTASRTKIYFATWRPSTDIGVTAARCVKHRFLRVGCEGQIPRRLSLNTEYFNADVFFTAGPLSKKILTAYEDNDPATLERLWFINLFGQGPGFWQSGRLKPQVDPVNLPHYAGIYADGDDRLYWSGLDTAVWHEISQSVAKLNTIDTQNLDDIILNAIQPKSNALARVI